MCEPPDWLPQLIRFSDYGGKWADYVEAIYAVFRRDFIESQPQFRGRWVRCRRDIIESKEAGFWHCISEGADERNRTPDLRRCERIAWPRAIIDHADDPAVQTWSMRKRRDNRTYLWYNQEYLVVLGERRRTCQLITAFQTDREHTIQRLRKELKRARNS